MFEINGLDPPPRRLKPDDPPEGQDHDRSDANHTNDAKDMNGARDRRLSDPEPCAIDMSMVASLRRADTSDSEDESSGSDFYSPDMDETAVAGKLDDTLKSVDATGKDDLTKKHDTTEGRRRHRWRVYPWRVYVYNAVAAWTSLAFGYCVGLISATLLYIPSMEQTEAVVVVAMTLFGALVGALPSHYVAEWLGRKWTLAGLYGFAVLSSVGCALSQQPWHLMLWRFVLGLGVGGASVVPGAYIAETCPSRLKAAFHVINQMFGSVGIAVALFVCAAVGGTGTSVDADSTFRWMFATGCVLAVAGFVATVSILPESPRWLIVRERKGEARRLLDRIYGPANAGESGGEFRAMCDYAMNARRQHDEPWQDLIRRRNLRALAIALVLPALQQLGGAAAFIYFPAIIFATVGVERGHAVLLAALASIPQVLSFLLLVVFMERLGKRYLLMASFGGCALSLATLGGIFFAYLRSGSDMDAYVGTLVFVAFLAARLSHAAGVGPIPQILIPELVPSALRGKISAMSAAVFWLLNLVVAGAFLPSLQSVAPYVIFWLFAACMLAGVWFTWQHVKHVHGKALSEIERVHQLPVVSPDGANRSGLPPDSLITQLRPVVVIMPSSPPAPGGNGQPT